MVIGEYHSIKITTVYYGKKHHTHIPSIPEPLTTL